jgi:hypothetical protein
MFEAFALIRLQYCFASRLSMESFRLPLAKRSCKTVQEGNWPLHWGILARELFPESAMKPSILSNILLRGLIPAALALLLAFPLDAFAQSAAQDHIVSSQSLEQQVQSASRTRQQNIETVTNLLSTPIAERAMRNAHFDPVQVRTAVPTLSDQELANLATRAADVQQKISAGVLGFGLTTLLIIAIVILIVVAIVR